MQQSQAKTLYYFQSGLDNEMLYELYESDYESALQAFQIFLDEMEHNISDLNSGFQQKNISAFQKTIHRCKPVFSYVGLTDLSAVFQRIEDQCSQIKSLDQLNPSFPELMKKMKACFPVIDAERKRLEAFILNS